MKTFNKFIFIISIIVTVNSNCSEKVEKKYSFDYQVIQFVNNDFTSMCSLPNEIIALGCINNGVNLLIPKENQESMHCKLLIEHLDQINALCVTRDGYIITASNDNTIKFWNLKTGICGGTLRGHTDKILSLCSLFDGRIASGSADKSIRIWDVDNFKCEILSGHAGEVTALAQLKNGNLVSGSSDGVIKIWDLSSTDEEGISITDHKEKITSLNVLDDGRLISSSSDRNINIYNLDKMTFVQLAGLHSNEVKSICVLQDKLISCSSDCLVIWNLWRSDLDPSSVHYELLPRVDLRDYKKVCVLGEESFVSLSSGGMILIWRSIALLNSIKKLSI